MDFKEWSMTKGEWEMFNHQKKLDKVYEQNRFYCQCGHSVTILPSEERIFCNYCGHWVYRSKKKQQENIANIKKEDFKNKVRKNIKRLQLKESFRNKLKEIMNNGRKKNLI